MTPSLLWNPIVAKEYRSRMRTWRSPFAITLYVLLLGGLGWLVFAGISSSAGSPFGGGQAAAYGRNLFTFLIIFQLLLLTFITPALTAGTISGERERQTIDLLFCTRVRPFAILWGKLLASMSFVLLLLVISIPIFSLVFLFGGIELDQVVTSFLVTGVAALTLGAMGIFFSTIAPRTLPSTVAAYGAAFVLLFGTLLIATLRPTEFDSNTRTTPAPPAISYLSPITALGAIVSDGSYFGPLPWPMVRPRSSPASGAGGSTYCYPTPGGGKQCVTTGASAPLIRQGPGPTAVLSGPSSQASVIPAGPFAGWRYWQASITLDLGLSAVALILSAMLLPPVRRFPWKRIGARVK